MYLSHSLCLYIYIYIYIYTHTQTNTYDLCISVALQNSFSFCVYIRYKPVYNCVCLYIYIYILTHKPIHMICVYQLRCKTLFYLCIYKPLYNYVFIYIYIYIYTHAQASAYDLCISVALQNSFLLIYISLCIIMCVYIGCFPLVEMQQWLFRSYLLTLFSFFFQIIVW